LEDPNFRLKQYFQYHSREDLEQLQKRNEELLKLAQQMAPPIPTKANPSSVSNMHSGTLTIEQRLRSYQDQA